MENAKTTVKQTAVLLMLLHICVFQACVSGIGY